MSQMKFKKTLRDGNCLFNAVECVLEYEVKNMKLKKKDQEKRAMELRVLTVKYLKQLVREDALIRLMIEGAVEDDEEIFDMEHYFDCMMEDGEWGGNVEIVAIAKMLNRSIVVYHQKKREYRLMGGFAIDNESPPIKLLYRGQSHYDFFLP